jgi:hypothetical protein
MPEGLCAVEAGKELKEHAEHGAKEEHERRQKRFSPNFRSAFDAWLATNPATNPNAPPGPTYMPQYQQPELTHANQLDAQATAEYAAGAKAGSNSDGYIRITVCLATVLFLAGIGSHFGYRVIRYGLAGVGFAILSLSIVLLVTAPAPP